MPDHGFTLSQPCIHAGTGDASDAAANRRSPAVRRSGNRDAHGGGGCPHRWRHALGHCIRGPSDRRPWLSPAPRPPRCPARLVRPRAAYALVEFEPLYRFFCLSCRPTAGAGTLRSACPPSCSAPCFLSRGSGLAGRTIRPHPPGIRCRRPTQQGRFSSSASSRRWRGS